MKISWKHRKEHLKRVNFAICELHFNKQKLLYQAPIPDSCRWRMSCLTLDSSTAPQMPAEHHHTFCPDHLRSHFWNLSRNYFQSPKELLLMNATKNACAQGQTSFEDRNHRVNAVPSLPGGTLRGTFLYFLGVLPTETEPTTHCDHGLHKLLLVWLSPVSCFNLLCTHASFLGVFFQHKPLALKSWSHGLRESMPCHPP